MNNSLSIVFGEPEHGWLPVDLHYNDFHLAFDASDVINDPIEELYNAVTKLCDNDIRRVTWYLEPGGIFFDFEKQGQSITLTILETEDLHRKVDENKQLIIITQNKKEVIKPFRTALWHFSSKTYEEIHWPYRLDNNSIKDL
ncbi:MAG: hypothetical protein U0264_18760 [Candidatus Kapaibacterium sp.]